jgi:O-acetyl-ADP-ribose deacetylase (regulator of RNase III)
MDIFWANAGVHSLPSSQRVEVLVHDGASDLRLWPGPGPDRNLLDAYGPGLREALEKQREKRGNFEIGEVVRLHPGKLHCNYLLWAVTRGPEENAQQADAPALDVIERVVLRCLEMAANNNSVSVGFGALGEGPKALNPEERLAAIVRAAHRYHETTRAARVEIVRVCDPRGGITAAARRLVGRLAQSAPEPPQSVREALAGSSSPAKKTIGGGASRPRTNTATVSSKRRLPETLDANDVAHRRVTSAPYDRALRYKDGDWFVHPRFGVGQVKRVTPEGAIEVLFEDGSTKKMLHSQSG